jgi:hypothetical protein
MVEVIVCLGNNKDVYEIIRRTGLRYGCRLPEDTPDGDGVYFADQNWKKPNLDNYLRSIQKHKPHIATVIDIESEPLFDEAMRWAYAISNHVRQIIMIPKIESAIERIPYEINGSEIVLGYSVPTSHGGTPISIAQFVHRKVHLLGGSPHKQLKLARENKLAINSIDNNYIWMKANKFGEYWTGKMNGESRTWIRSSMLSGKGGRLDAFEKSCINLLRAWSTYV